MDIAYDPWPNIDDKIDFELALQSLTDKQRRTIQLALRGWTQSEIADVMGVSQAMVSRVRAEAIQVIKNSMTCYN